MPLFHEKALKRNEPLFWEHIDCRAMRKGKWKIVRDRLEGASWELYDMEVDRTELNDLSLIYPERVKAMETQWDSWARRCAVLPKP